MSMMDVAGTQQRERGRLTQLLTRALHPRRDVIRRPAAAMSPSRVTAKRTVPRAVELSERPAMRAVIASARDSSRVLTAFAEAGVTLPDDVRLVPSRLGCHDSCCAAGFVDTRTARITVDIAVWNTPPAAEVDAGAWCALFRWIVTPDTEIRRARVDGSVTIDGMSATASYVYECEGNAGRGVLAVTALPNGAWQIVDCWGDAADAARIQELSRACRASR